MVLYYYLSPTDSISQLEVVVNRVNQEWDLYSTPEGCYYESKGVIYVVKNLRKFRLDWGISQQKLADIVGVSQQSINKYENHKVEPDIDTLIKFADFFGVTLDALTGHESQPTESVQPPGLTEEEQRVLQDYRRLSRREKDSIRLVMQNYLRKEPYI